MPKSYYVVVFIMLIAIMLLLTYIAAGVVEIRNKIKVFDAYIDSNHPRFIKILDYSSSNYINLEKLADLKNSLDAKKNFIEGLDHVSVHGENIIVTKED